MLQQTIDRIFSILARNHGVTQIEIEGLISKVPQLQSFHEHVWTEEWLRQNQELMK